MKSRHLKSIEEPSPPFDQRVVYPTLDLRVPEMEGHRHTPSQHNGQNLGGDGYDDTGSVKREVLLPEDRRGDDASDAAECGRQRGRVRPLRLSHNVVVLLLTMKQRS